MHPTVCRPEDVARLLPEVLAGRMVLAPVVDDSALAALRPDEPAEVGSGVVATTSGSTGTAKGVVLSTDALLAAGRAARERCDALGLGQLTWTNVLPDHYVAGLMVHVRAAVDGTAVRVASSHLDDLDPDPTRANAISIVPTQLFRAMGDEDVLAALARYDLVLLGGAAVDEGLLADARARGLHLVTTYGMSETCGGCVWDGVPLPGVDLRIGDQGRISLAGPMVFSGYRCRPDLTAEVLVGGAVSTNDRGVWADGVLKVLGRLDDVVISGGVNVDLAGVQREVDALGGDPAVVVGLLDAEWGQRVSVVVTDSRDLDWFQDRLRGQLPAAALPRRLERVDVLPLTSSGKIDRRAIVAQLGPAN